MNIEPNAVKSRISQTLHIPMSLLRDDAPIREVVTESFALVEMVIDLQEEFSVSLHQSDLARVKTVGDLVSLIASA